MTAWRRLGFAAFAALACASAPRSARAESPEELFDRAAAAMDRHAYVEACALFDESYTMSRATGPLQGLAACYEARGLYRQALLFWREADRTLPDDSPARPAVRAAVKRLEGKVAVVTLALAEDAPRATTVEIDGELVAADGSPVELDPAVVHKVVSTAPGARPRETELRLEEGEHRTIPIAPAAVARAVGPVRGVGIGLAVLGGVGFATAAVTGGMLLARADTIDAGCAGPNHTGCNASALAASDSAHALAPWNVAGWVVGVAATGAAIPMIVVGDPPRAHAESGVSARLVVRGPTVALEGSF